MLLYNKHSNIVTIILQLDDDFVKTKRKDLIKMLANADIRAAAKGASVRMWEIADHLNISEPTMSRKLRHELPQTEKDRIFSIIEEIAAEKQAVNA